MAEEQKDTFLAKSHLLNTGNSKMHLTDSTLYPFSHSEYKKIPQPPSLDVQIRRMHLLLENWKHIILHVNSVLLWEKPWHPTAIICGSTIIFMLLWLANPNNLTILSLIGLIVTVADYIVPSLSTSIFKQEFTEEQQQQYDDICTNIVLIKTKAELLLSSFFKMRVKNPKLYIIITFSTLSLLAWIGATINNLFLTYLIVTFLLLVPGLDGNGILDKWIGCLSKIYTELVENTKSRMGQSKKQQ